MFEKVKLPDENCSCEKSAEDSNGSICERHYSPGAGPGDDFRGEFYATRFVVIGGVTISTSLTRVVENIGLLRALNTTPATGFLKLKTEFRN